MKFGKRTVVGEVFKKGSNLYYNCICECGSKDAVRATDLKHGRSTACRSCTFSPLSNIDRFSEKWKVHPHRSLPGKGPCWEWIAGKAWNRGRPESGRYGRFYIDGKEMQAHRFSYEHYIGPIPEGLELDHLCEYKPCVNPLHLEAVLHIENVRRCGSLAGTKASAALRHNMTHCAKGLHEWTKENTITDKRGFRQCRTCNKARQRRNYAEKVAAKRRLVASATSVYSAQGTGFAR
jgi:hypothetical protein